MKRNRWIGLTALGLLWCLLLAGCGGTAELSTAERIAVEVKVDPVQYGHGETADGSPENTFVDVNGETVSYLSVQVGECTAYTNHKITSTGIEPYEGVVAVDPNIIPYGTKLYITEKDGPWVYGYAVAEDTGGAAMNGEIVCDLYMDTEEICLEFGRRDMLIYTLEEGRTGAQDEAN